MTREQLEALAVGSVVEFEYDFIWKGGTTKKERWQKLTSCPEDIWDRVHPRWMQSFQASKSLQHHPCRVVSDVEILSDALLAQEGFRTHNDKSSIDLSEELEIFLLLHRCPEDQKAFEIAKLLRTKRPWDRTLVRAVAFYVTGITFVSAAAAGWVSMWLGTVVGSGLGKFILSWLTQ